MASEPEFFTVPDYFGWGDGGLVELRSADGKLVRGDLSMDVGFDGEDEYPIPEIRLADGSIVSPFDFAEMRYLSERKRK